MDIGGDDLMKNVCKFPKICFDMRFDTRKLRLAINFWQQCALFFFHPERPLSLFCSIPGFRLWRKGGKLSLIHI